MQNAARINLLSRVARSFSTLGSVPADKPASILSLAAASYGTRPSGDATVPTGFDPLAIALFEAIVEGAYLVANADGVFDDNERRAFESVVIAACGGTIVPHQIEVLVGELEQQLRVGGLERRIDAVARAVTKREQAQEILRIAALLAQVSEDVSTVERDVLVRLATRCGLQERDVDAALADVASLLAVQSPLRG
jgi:tellurite resistance protein